MAEYKPKVISLTKRPGQTFGFYLRLEHGEEGHLVRCLDMGGPAELAGMKDGDRIIRVNGTFTDELSHSVVVDLVRNSGASCTFHILNEASFKKGKAEGVNLSKPQSTSVANGVANPAPNPKLCYLLKSGSEYGFSLRSDKSEPGLFMTAVTPGSVADRAGVKANDRLLEVNGETVEDSTHDQAVDKIRLAGANIMFLLADEGTDRYYQSKRMKIEACLATTKDIDRGSPAERSGLKDMDRLVAVDGEDMDSSTHLQVVDKIWQSGKDCCLLVVDKDTDQMYGQGKVSPMLFWEEMKGSNSPPSYTEAINLPATVQQASQVQVKEEELKPKLCRMERTSAGYGFHLKGIQGIHGQYLEVEKGGAADRAGLNDEDVVMEVNGVNVEQSTHEEVVEIIRDSGSSLEMLVAKKSVYHQLTAKGVSITRLLLEETSCAQVHNQESKEEARPETPSGPARERISSVSSSASHNSFDERL
ncbi:unnamed protein product [Pleuronectes platessa]|uniref:PDZ domain-containing protein n=1 Tax=Pleuronectes platessa TaxID=8262 RepID=A0A9N7VF48_PLEPL|nr:unnamed protein product [Pleuronectes platessa]